MIYLIAGRWTAVNLINGILLLAAAIGIAWRYRPVKAYSWLSLGICAFAAVVAFLSAPPSSLAVGAFLGLLEVGLVGFSFLEVRAEYRARKRRMSKPCASRHSDQTEEKPLAG